MKINNPFTISHFSAALSALLVSYGSAAVIIYQAAQSFGATNEQITSWFTIIGIICGVTTLYFSLRFRAPIMLAWCTPGAALMVGLNHISLAQATAGFMFAGLLMWIISACGLFDRMVKLIPATLASAMLAGILINFGSRVFQAMQMQTLLVGVMLMVYLLSKIRFPKYSILLMLMSGLVCAQLMGLIRSEDIMMTPPTLIWVNPEWHLGSVIGVGVPLFIAAFATQNVPGVAIMRAYDYHVPAKPIISGTGLATAVFAPLGMFMLNLAAISAAICMGSDVDKDPTRRYLANILLSIMYLLCGLAGGMMVSIFVALPNELLVALAGIAILGTLQTNLIAAWQDEHTREASLITLLTSASGLSLLGISSAFWGLVFGVVVYHLNQWVANKKQ